MTFRAPSRMPVVASMALRTGEAPRRTALCTRTRSAAAPSSAPSTRIATSADSASASTLSQVSTTPSDTARLARMLELERISMASSMASRSSFHSPASVILMARSAASRHWRADFPKKASVFVSFRCPRFSRYQNFCTLQEKGAAALGSAPRSMASLSSASLDCFSAKSSPMRSPKPSLLAALPSDSEPASSRILPNSTACRGEPKSGWRPRQSKLLMSTP
mmetsp:Transcript_36234/g.108321  ORF Transcript_36234/g.108321 Transcript_36234/m.108321 type:complete len:221 (-) Transcript_36234:205-867(-)